MIRITLIITERTLAQVNKIAVYLHKLNSETRTFIIITLLLIIILKLLKSE